MLRKFAPIKITATMAIDNSIITRQQQSQQQGQESIQVRVPACSHRASQVTNHTK